MLNKIANEQFILNNLDKYVLDSRGNFIHADFIVDCEEEEKKYSFIGKEAVNDWEKVIKAIYSMILKNKEDWRVVKDNGYYIENKKDVRKINCKALIEINNKVYYYGYRIIGELGYREGAWEDYDERIAEDERFEEEERQMKEWWERFYNEQINFKQEWKEQDLNNPQNQENKEQTNNNPLPEKKDDSTSNSPPPPSETQNNYNSDKDKSEIDNNSNLTTPESKEQANELLKIVISAELLIKKKQFNSELLTKLITEKKNNSSSYQLLNKEGRIDKAIKSLESIKNQSKKGDSNSLQKNKDNHQVLIGIVVVGGILLLLGLGMIAVVRKRKIYKRRVRKSK